MPKLTEELTDKTLRHLPVPATGSVLWRDPVLTGFTGRVTSSGSRAFVACYYFDGVERRDTIGTFPSWKAKAAREVFNRWRRDADLGIDPRGEAEPEKPEKLLFRPLAEQFLAHGRTKRGRLLEPATVREYRRALVVYAKTLHDRPVDEIRRGDVARVIDGLAAKPVTAMRARAALSRFWSWMVARGYVEANVVTGTEGYSTPKGERVLTDAELRALHAATEEPDDFGMITRVCLWTGCRRSEAGGMRDSELVDGEWRIPGTRTKNHRPLVLPMSRQMREALDAWPRRPGRDLLFGHGPNGFQGWSACKARLDARLGFDQAWDLHDLRRTVQTRLAGLGIREEVVNRTLNHAMGPIDEAYNQHRYLPEKAHALQAWADALERIVGETPPNVLPIRAAS